MDWLALLFVIELGINPGAHFSAVNDSVYELASSDTQIYTYLEGGLIAFDLIYAKGGVKTYVYKNGEGVTFLPVTADYNIDVGINYENTILAGYRYHCIHPVVAIISQDLSQMWQASYSEIFIRFQSGY